VANSTQRLLPGLPSRFNIRPGDYWNARGYRYQELLCPRAVIRRYRTRLDVARADWIGGLEYESPDVPTV